MKKRKKRRDTRGHKGSGRLIRLITAVANGQTDEEAAMCGSKLPFASEEAVKRWEMRGRAYQCPYCGQWHHTYAKKPPKGHRNKTPKPTKPPLL